MPTAIIAPEISPPGRPAHKNSRPPAAPMASVSSVLRDFGAVGKAEAIEAGIGFTPPYGKSAMAGQMRWRDAAMRDRVATSADRRAPRRATGEAVELASHARLVLVGGGLLAFGAEFLALLALQALGVGFLGAFERGGRARLLGLLFGRCRGVGLGRRRSWRRRRGLRRRRSPSAAAKRRRSRWRRQEISSWEHLGWKEGRNRRAAMLNRG